MKFMLINLETSQHGRALSPAQFSCVGGVRICGELEFRHVKELGVSGRERLRAAFIRVKRSVRTQQGRRGQWELVEATQTFMGWENF